MALHSLNKDIHLPIPPKIRNNFGRNKIEYDRNDFSGRIRIVDRFSVNVVIETKNCFERLDPSTRL